MNFWQTVQLHEDKTEVPEFISTHPSNTTRAENLSKILPWALDIRRQCNCFPLSESKPLGALNFSKNPDEKVLLFVIYLEKLFLTFVQVMEPFDKRVGGFRHIPVVETVKNE